RRPHRSRRLLGAHSRAEAGGDPRRCAEPLVSDRWRSLARRLLGRAGLYVTRNDPNRFDAMDSALAHLAAKGYAPRVILDGGSNFGQWAARARAAFPAARLHLIEPQAACGARLERLVREDRNAELHRVALS